MTDKIKLEKDTYLNIKAMLESEDSDDHTVAFECIENSDTKTNLIYTLLLIKETNIGMKQWMLKCNKTMSKLNKIYEIPDLNNMSYSLLIKLLNVYKAPSEDYQFLMDRYAEHVKNKLNKDADNEIIESLQIIVKKKENESRTIS